MTNRSVLVALLVLGSAAGCAAGAGAPPTETADGAATVALDQRARIGAVAVTALRIEEDSRCPTGVQCIQAGTVRAAVRVEEAGRQSEELLTLSQPHRLDSGRWLTLAAVCPYPRHPGPIAPASYRFTFVLGADGQAPPPALACDS